jgi:predicted dehydrogenase
VSDKAVPVGLVGAGRRAELAYAPALTGCPTVEFVGIWARSPNRLHRLAERYGVPAYDRYADLLDRCDAVVFAVPPAAQPELAATAALSGKAVLLGRPIATDEAGAEEAALAVANRNVVSQLALPWRYSAAVRSFLTEVPRISPAGGTGRVVGGAPAGEAPANPWRRALGALYAEGADMLDLLDAALGSVAHVHAHGDRRGWLGMMLDHLGGRFSEASLYWTGAAEPRRAEVEIFGPDGSAAIDCTGVVGPETFQTMVGEFAGAVRRAAPPALDVQRGLHLQRLIEAIETDLVTDD